MNSFIDRPIFATAIAMLMVIAGVVAMLTLPVSQYPPLVPPQIQVSTQFIGAGAGVTADSVTTPLEEKINGAAGILKTPYELHLSVVMTECVDTEDVQGR